MTGRFLVGGSVAPIDWVSTWVIQSTVLLAAGLLAGRWLRRCGPAVQSTLYRTTMAAVILCPIASMAMAAMGFSGLVIHLPGTIGGEPTRGGIPDRDRHRLRTIAEREASPNEIVPVRTSGATVAAEL